MILTSEFIFNNPKLDQKSKVIKNTEREHIEKYGCNEKRKIELICYVAFIDMMENKMKNV